MRCVKEVLGKKGSDIWFVSPDTTVYQALQLMEEKNCGAVLVLAEGKLAGIFSERDYARKVVLRGHSSKDVPVHEIMSSKVVCVRPDQTMADCMELMTDKRIRHLPVTEEGDKLVGLISIGDVVKEIITEQEVIIDELEHYIMDSQ